MSNEIANSGEILLYSYEGSKTYIDVYFQDETFWLTQAGMAELFDCISDNISLHLKNIYEEEELIREATTEKFSVVRKEGNRQVNRTMDFYNLDAIIAVGYRINSKKATRFRQWATRTLREYIQKGFVLNDELMKNGRADGRGRATHEHAGLAQRDRPTVFFRTTASACWTTRAASPARKPPKRSAMSTPSSARSRTRTMFRSSTARRRSI